MAMTLMEFVKQHPQKSPKEIAALAVKAGVKCKDAQAVSNARHYLKVKSGEAVKSKRATATNDPLYEMILRRGTETAQRYIDQINARDLH